MREFDFSVSADLMSWLENNGKGGKEFAAVIRQNNIESVRVHCLSPNRFAIELPAGTDLGSHSAVFERTHPASVFKGPVKVFDCDTSITPSTVFTMSGPAGD